MPDGRFVEGRDLMLYVAEDPKEAATVWLPTAAATSHTISYSGETKERVTKDTENGAFSEKFVTKLNVSITCEALTVIAYKVSFQKLLELMKTRKPVRLKYGFSVEEDGDKYEEGLFVITSLEQNSPADDDATYSATFENSGVVETKIAGQL